MFSIFSLDFLSVCLAFGALVTALPADSPKDIRGVCNADLCLGMLTNRPTPATAYCESLISKTPGTVTVTEWASTTTTDFVSTYTSNLTVLKRAVSPTAIADLIPLSCTSSKNAPVTYRASSACYCLLSTSATFTVTSTGVSTLGAVATTISTVSPNSPTPTSSSSSSSTTSSASAAATSSSSSSSSTTSIPSSAAASSSSFSSSSSSSTSSSLITTSSSSASASSTSTSPTRASCSSAPRPSNLISDTGFEDTPSQWSFLGGEVTSTLVNSGTYAAELNSNSADYSIVYQFFPYTSVWGETLYLSYAAKFSGSSDNNCVFHALTGSGTVQEVDNISEGFDWQCFTATWDVEDGDESSGFAFDLVCTDDSAALYIDDVYFGPIPPGATSTSPN